MVSTRSDYRRSREELLTKITEAVSRDERFVAGWFTGSFGRNEADALSDIDLTLVVANEHSTELCHRLERASAQTTPERFALFGQFGTPALIHENNGNAPEGGTLTFVMYSGSATMVDWVLMPRIKATRPSPSILLFDKVGISVSPPPEPEDMEQSKKHVAEQWAFFWMMTAVTIKYISRQDGVFVAHWIENLQNLIRDIKSRLGREPWKYTRGSLSKLQPTQEKQIESIRHMCQQMMKLKLQILEFTGVDPAAPLAEIETLLSFVNTRRS